MYVGQVRAHAGAALRESPFVVSSLDSVPFSGCSLNSLNCVDISGCHTDRSLLHTPPNQDGRATPSPEHALTADSEEMNSFDDDSPPRDIHGGGGGFSHTTAAVSTNTKNTKDKEPTDENFNSFHYWRSPLPDISGELEMMNCPKSSQAAKQQQQQQEEEEEQQQEQEEKEEREEAGNHFPEAKSSPGKATSDQIQKVLDCLQPHMDDPDVQGQWEETEFHSIPGRIPYPLSEPWQCDTFLQLRSRCCLQH